MSFLAPLYVLGALGIGLPILFHLIRRQPRGQWRFSSLMFLKPTPPTLTRRSRLENWPLLLLRALALMLLAAAFARPFLRSPLIEPDDLPGKRIVLLIDTSASMRRTGLWPQVNQLAAEVLQNLKPMDQIAIVSFDTKPRVEMSLEQSAALELNARREAASKAINQLRPTWAASELGAALILAADLLATTESDALPDSRSEVLAAGKPVAPAADKGQIVVISDMQVGSEQNLKSLQAYSWPKEIKTELRSVISSRRTNAVASILQPRAEDADETPESKDGAAIPSKTRVRIANCEGATTADFTIAWALPTGERIESTQMPVHVGPGESHVAKMIEPPSSITDTTALRLVLSGDDHDFDNIRYVVRPEPIEQQLMFIGPTTGEPRESLLYYLQRAPLDNRRRKVTIITTPSTSIPEQIDVNKTPLVIVAEPLADPAIESLRRYVSSGGGLLWVLDKNSDLALAQRSLSLLAAAPGLAIAEAPVKDYAMWSKIDFGHPLFRPLADAKYNDFTKIRFWSHRKLTGLTSDSKTIASFDDGDPGIVEQTIGQGQLWIIATGWQPTNSQLALSTKFVPLIDGLYGFHETAVGDVDQVVIGDEPPFAASPTARIEHANDPPISYRTPADFAAVDQPGFYRFVDGDVAQSFAVNVAESESRTQPLASDELERYGVQMGAMSEAGDSIATQRQQRDIELESRQHLWQWLLLAVLGLLAIESWLSGYLDRKQTRQLQAS